MTRFRALSEPGGRGRALLLWAALLAAVFSGRMYTTDVVAQYQVAGSFLGLRPFLTAETGWTVEGAGGESYVPHGPGFSLILVPAAASGALVAEGAGKVAAGGINALLSLLLMACWMELARRRLGDACSPLRVVALGLGAMLLVYGRMPYDVTAAGAAILAGLVLQDRGDDVWAGVLLGAALLIRLDSAVALPAFWRGPRRTARLLPGLALSALLWGLFNWHRFGSPLRDGHGQDPAAALDPASLGIAGLLVSPGKGLVFYAPVVFLGLARCRDWRLWTPLAASVLLHGLMHDWTGGTGWGPRFLVPVLPLALLPLCRRGAGGWAFWVLCAWGGLMTLAASWSNPNAIEQSLGPDSIEEPGRRAVVWTFSRSPWVTALRRIGSGAPDILGAHAARAAGAPAAAGAGLQLAASAALAWAALTGRGRRKA